MKVTNVDIVSILILWFIGHAVSPELLSAEKRHTRQYVDGHILIGGLITVHQMEGKSCTKLSEIGVQTLEAINMVIDKVNANDAILKGVTLGSIMADTCNDDAYALQQVVTELLRHFTALDGGSRQAGRSDNSKHVFAGVVGASASAISIQIAKLLQVFHIPQISFSSTDPSLSNKDQYPYFFRTVPSDVYQVKGIVSLIKERGWKYVSIVYDDSQYGIHGHRGIAKLLQGTDICLAVEEIIPIGAGPADNDKIVRKLLEKENATVVILFASHFHAKDIIKVAQKLSPGKFLWVASDGWAGVMDPGIDLEFENGLDGSIGITHDSDTVPGLDKYIANVTIAQSVTKKNPWFAEYIALHNDCTLKPEKGKRVCNPSEHIDESTLRLFTIPQSAADATLAFVYALDKYHKKICGEKGGFCREIAQLAGTNKLAESLYGYLKNTSFNGISGRHVEFDRYHDGPPDFCILQYQRNVKAQNGLKKWRKIGLFNGTTLHWTATLTDKANRIVSLCSRPCGKNEETVYTSEACCFVCEPCDQNEYIPTNASACKKCPLGETPNDDGNGCTASPVFNMSYGKLPGIVCLIFSIFGLLLTLMVIAIYIKYLGTPVVKASGSELSFMVLSGAMITLFNSFVIATAPNASICAFARIILGLGPTLMYSGLLTKTMRVVIIFRSKLLSPQTKLFLRPCSQIALTLLIVSVEIFIIVIWLTSVPPDAAIIYTDDAHSFFTCRNLTDITILVGLIYPFLLILICTVLATVNRHVPVGFRETMLIGFTMYTTCVIWLAFLPIFLTNPDHYPLKLTTLSICLSLSAFTTLFCLFLPYCYKMIFKSNENTSQTVMSSSKHSKSRSDHSGL